MSVSIRMAVAALLVVCFLMGSALNRSRNINRSLRINLLLEKEFERVRELRGLYFGTSRTWGTGLKDHERHMAYPWKVSDHTTNLAIRGTGPQYPAMCFESMIGEDARFDFVVFEYYAILAGSEARLIDLAKRVRARFPKATLIFMTMEEPDYYKYKPTGQTIQDVLNESGTKVIGGLYEPITPQQIFHATYNHMENDWKLEPPLKQRVHIETAAKAVGGKVWSPVSLYGSSPYSTLSQARMLGSLYFRDGIHFNKQGHEITANGIKAILASEKVQHSDVVGPWDSHDVCSTWYETGSISLDHSPGLNMYSWARTEGALRGGKFALEIPDSGGWIKVKNPTDKYLGLYMYYMVTAPQQFYPEADVTVSKSLFPVDVGNPEFQMKIRPLDTIHLMSMGVHMIKGTKLGNVGPGEHFVSISPKEKRVRPFRITGIALTEHGKSDEMEGFFQ